ncbi:hypothetical protein CCACVL1_20429 [Corchorus capsularis]|uniref:Uncharacterized protein n=1 Tax=Corchorus capsularis TaxID=210143 RepID=A0A1R3HB94_COCAP|nr:hypothetical protein CCACVL1_20429 [Corchorus capsularis]
MAATHSKDPLPATVNCDNQDNLSSSQAINVALGVLPVVFFGV